MRVGSNKLIKLCNSKVVKVCRNFQRIAIDFAEYTDKRNGTDKYSLLVIVDFFSR